MKGLSLFSNTFKSHVMNASAKRLINTPTYSAALDKISKELSSNQVSSFKLSQICAPQKICAGEEKIKLLLSSMPHRYSQDSEFCSKRDELSGAYVLSYIETLTWDENQQFKLTMMYPHPPVLELQKIPLIEELRSCFLKMTGRKDSHGKVDVSLILYHAEHGKFSCIGKHKDYGREFTMVVPILGAGDLKVDTPRSGTVFLPHKYGEAIIFKKLEHYTENFFTPRASLVFSMMSLTRD